MGNALQSGSISFLNVILHEHVFSLLSLLMLINTVSDFNKLDHILKCY